VTEENHDHTSDRSYGPARSMIWSQEIPARNLHFTGRQEELRTLRGRLADSSIEVLSQPPQAIYGLGGIGKTEIAVEYAHRHAGDYDIVWWVRAEHVDRVRDSLVKLGRQLNLEDSYGHRDRSIWAVLDALRQGRPFSRWLLIYDNAARPEEVNEYIPKASYGGHVIITSREQQWRKITRAEGIEVTEFTPDESVTFLRSRVKSLRPEIQAAGGESGHDAARQLAEALGNLPIAMDHAAAYIDETGVDVDTYLKMYRKDPYGLLSEAVDTEYPRAVANTWSISVAQLGDDASEIFKLCAFFSPEPIAEELFLGGGSDVHAPVALRAALSDVRRFRQAVRQLHRYSLARIDGKRNVLVVHRVVQAVTRSTVEMDGAEACSRYQAAVHALLAASDPRNPDRENNDAQYDRSLQHLRPAGAIDTDNPALRRLVINQVRRLHMRGGFQDSLELGEQALKAWQARFGPTDEQVLQLAVEVGIAMRLAGRAEEAQELNRETYELLLREYGEDHEVTLICANSYGGDLRAMGRFDEALTLDQHLLPLFERVFLPEHYRTLNVRNNLAADYRRLGRFKDALEQDQHNSAERERILGPFDLRTLTSKDAVSLDLRGCGEYDLALDVAREVMAVLSNRTGGDNPDVLNAHKGFAVALRKAGLYEDALHESEQVLQRYRDYYGRAQHRYALRAAVNYINDLRLAERLTEAEEFGRETLAQAEKLEMGKADIVYAAMVNLAVVLRLRNKPAAAREKDEEALGGISDYFGAEHPFALIAATNLASDMVAVGDLREARERGEQILQVSRRVRGESHPDTLGIAANLSLDRRASGDVKGADELREDTMRRYDETLSMEHPVARIAWNRGRVNVDIEPY
jgi:tetratricopeptide (TPR) repeat protein